MKNIALFMILLVVSVTSSAQINLNIELQDVINQKSTSVLLDNSNAKGVVIVFMSNECPFSLYYINRLKKIENIYKSKGIEVAYINSFTSSDESIKEMTTFGNKHKLSNYFADKNQQLKKQLSARKSPEVFLLKNNGGKFLQFYKGPIDNNAQVESDVKFHYLKENIENLLTGKPASKSNTPIMGCVIK